MIQTCKSIEDPFVHKLLPAQIVSNHPTHEDVLSMTHQYELILPIFDMILLNRVLRFYKPFQDW